MLTTGSGGGVVSAAGAPIGASNVPTTTSQNAFRKEAAQEVIKLISPFPSETENNSHTITRNGFFPPFCRDREK
jgi:hypothetical protein